MENPNKVVFGSKLEALGSSEMNSLNIDYGVKVLEVNKGKFKDIGMSHGYIILSVNGKKVKNPDDIRQFTADGTKLKSMEGILPDGTILNYQFGN